MRAMEFVLSVAVLGFGAFAGCVSSSGSDADLGPAGPAAGPQLEDGTGGVLTGLVTDDELRPLAAAQVGLVEIGSIAWTGADGVFTLRAPAGTYTAAVQALGFEAHAKRVTIGEGETVTLNVQLVGLPSDAPHSFTDIKKSSQRTVVFKLTPQCVYSDVDPLATTCNGIRFNCVPAGACEVHYSKQLEKEPYWNTIVGEVDWAPQSAATGKANLFDINAPNITRGTGGSIVPGDPYTWKAMDAKAPLTIRIDNPASLEERNIKAEDYCCDWFFRLFTGWCDLGGATVGDCDTIPDYGISVDNVATVYFTIFWKEGAPTDFTAIPDQ